MSRRLLVVTTVHQSDDVRIRSKLIATLASDWDITYASRIPGPSDPNGFTWLPLPGNRLRRWIKASATLMSSRWSLVAIHDPELVPAGIARSLRGRATLFDLHENLPAQIRHKPWIPSILRPVLAWVSGRMLRWAESTMTVTLAEKNYQSLFRRDHPVLENYLLVDDLPDPVPPSPKPFLAYVGDITVQRGAFMAVEAAAGAEVGLVMVGRVTPAELRDELAERANRLGVDLTMTGPLPHSQAMARVAGAVGGLSPLEDVPNYRNSLPTKILEYLALGLPVLASDLPGTRIVTDGRAGVTLVAPGDANAWSQAGRVVMSDPELRLAAQSAADEIRQRYRWPSERVLSVYRAAVPG